MRTAWLIWGIATLALGAYCVSGLIASHSTIVPIVLSAGFTENQNLFRFGRDHLRMELEFKGKHTDRPDLGQYRTKDQWRTTGRLEFSDPGAEVVLKASLNSSEAPVPYSALPKTGYTQGLIFRDLVAELKEAPGVWKWPPTSPGLELMPGTNDVRITVAAVGPKLVGESVNLVIRPEIGFKACGSQVCWLWGWFAWPLFLVTQSFWAFFLFRQARKSNDAAN